MAADQFYHLVGEKDSVHRYAYLAPGRWPITFASDWNRAKRQGKVTEVNMGAVGHTGRGGYLDHNRQHPDGMSFMDRTVAAVAGIIAGHLPPAQARPEPSPATPVLAAPALLEA
jgi:hypothetical protein